MRTTPPAGATRTLEHAPWGDGRAEVLREGALAAATTMRENYASTVVWGSLELSEALLRAGLVDELRLRIVPVLLGAGRTFVPPNLGVRAVRLKDVERYDTGHLTVTYRVARGGDAR